MSELLRELEEDIRRDQMKDIWKRYSAYVIGLVAAIVLGTAGGVAWKSYSVSRNETLTAQLIAASSVGDTAKRGEAYAQLIKDAGSRSHGALASLRLAADQLAAGKQSDALATYRAVVEGSYPVQFRMLARVLATHVAIDSGEELKLGAVEIGKDAPYYDTMREAEAWRLLSTGEKQKAFERFSALAEDVEAPATQRSRMNTVVSYLAATITEE